MQNPNTTTQALLAALWRKNRPEFVKRIELLERASAEPTLYDDALAAAHKLAGSLGMYGYRAATDAARLYEQELERPTPDPTQLKLHVEALKAALD